jgi:L-ascorbate metabolism protein UlaG (beta-lactamase superfamily)
MNIEKIGHCCLLIEIDGVRILTDPGRFTTEQLQVKDVDGIIVTHVHADHLDMETFEKVLGNNPRAKIIANSEVAQIIKIATRTDRIKILDEGDYDIAGISIQAIPNTHVFIYAGIPVVKNTGFLINRRLYLPGDSYDLPKVPIEILALPLAAPWGKISETIDYAKKISPKICFPIHDGMNKISGPWFRLPKEILSKSNIEFKEMVGGDSINV